MKHVIVAALVLGTVVATPAAVAEECHLPPKKQIATADLGWLGHWCQDQAMLETLWTGLELHFDEWDQGWGANDVCSKTAFLPRLLNAAFIVREVSSVSQFFPTPSSPNLGHKWWTFVKDHENTGYIPWCCNDNNEPGECCHLANHVTCCTAEPTALCVAFGYRVGTAQRSAILIHEATHDKVGHESPNCPAEGSCDTYYGDFNASTMEINYIYDAVAAQEIEFVGSEPQRRVNVFEEGGKQMCRYVPLLSVGERNEMLARVKELLDRYFVQGGGVFPRYSDAGDVDRVLGTPWSCASCEVSDYTFAKGSFGSNRACNEITNRKNVAVNEAHREACRVYNGGIATASGPAALGRLKHTLHQATTLNACNTCLEKDTAAFCKERRAAAHTVEQLDPDGMLSSCGYTFESDCLASFCEERFKKPWAAHAEDHKWDDPAGCLDAVCGRSEKCRRRYLTYGGDPEFYDASGCDEGLIACYEKAGSTVPGHAVKPPLGGAPELPACTSVFTLCKAIESAKNRVFEYRLIKRWPDPAGGAESARANPWAISAEEAFRARLSALKQSLDEKALAPGEFEAEVERLLAKKESRAVAFSLEPAAFVDLFGRDESLEVVVGPAVRNVTPKRLIASDIDERGHAALRALDAMRATQHP